MLVEKYYKLDYELYFLSCLGACCLVHYIDIHSTLLLKDIKSFIYSNTCVNWPLSKRPKIGFQDQLSLNAGQKYCRMLQREHSAILSTFIKLPIVIKVFFSIFVWPFYTGSTVSYYLTWRHETGLSPPVKYFYCPFQGGTSFVDHLCYSCFVFVMLSCLFIAALKSPARKGLTSWLLFVMSICAFVTSHVVSWVRCGT